MPATIDIEQLVLLARSWLGVPWHHQGRSRAGVDCAGFPEALLREAGVLPANYRAPTNYGRLPLRGELTAVIERWCRPAAAALPGTMLTIRWPRMSGASHVALCTGPTIVHAYRASTGVVEHSYRGRWCRWTTAAWYLPGVRYE